MCEVCKENHSDEAVKTLAAQFPSADAISEKVWIKLYKSWGETNIAWQSLEWMI